jgi:uncharacterized membrane protein
MGHASSQPGKHFQRCTYQHYVFPIFMGLFFAKCINMDAGGSLVQSPYILDLACNQNCNTQVL